MAGNHPLRVFLKVTCVGAFSSESQTGGIGFKVLLCVIKKGSVWVVLVLNSVANVQSPEHVEALVGRAAIRYIQEQNLSPITFESDSIYVAGVCYQTTV